MAKANEAPQLFEVIQGGKQEIIEPKLAGNEPTGGDWLRELGYGTRFVCHPKSTVGCWLLQYGVAYVMDECILLAEDTGQGLKFSWCDSKRFSNIHKLVAVLPNPDEETGDTNGYHLPRPADGKDNDGHEGPA